MAKTFQQIINDVEKELSLVSGSAVQTYAEDEIGYHIQQTFNTLFKKRFWHAYSSWQTFTLDGTVGIPDADVDDVLAAFTDIEVAFRGGTNIKLPRVPSFSNPALLTGTTARFIGPYAANPLRVFQVWPNTAVGTITMHVRTHPGDFGDDDEILLDNDLLTLTAAVNMVSSDGAGSLQLQNLEQRRQEAEQSALSDEQGGIAVPINPDAYPYGSDEWQG